MTERQWLTSVAVMKMTFFIASRDGAARRKAARRKLRLFGCFSCRQLWEQMTDARGRHAVEVAERLADDAATPAEVKQAVEGARRAFLAVDPRPRGILAAVGQFFGSPAGFREATPRASEGTVEFSKSAATDGRLPDDGRNAAWGASLVLTGKWRSFTCRHLFYRDTDSNLARSVCPARRRAQADALRCIFGNPFRPVAVDPAWLTWNDGVVGKVARTVYDERAWEQMPVLGDALEDAGCTNGDVLAHCRGPGPHTRGCWVVDLILGLA